MASSPVFHRFYDFLNASAIFQFLAIWAILANFGAKVLLVGALRMPHMVLPTSTHYALGPIGPPVQSGACILFWDTPENGRMAKWQNRYYHHFHF